MRWSMHLGRLFGISLQVHVTFLLIVAWAAISGWNATGSAAGVVNAVAFVLVLFACVVAHELGHALVARRYGIETRDITLLPIGGVARLQRIPAAPGQELAVALAGPAVNLVIAGALYLILLAGSTAAPELTASIASGSFLQRLLTVNVFLALFNLLPAFPMDGGRVVRALLAMRMDYSRATQIAAGVGQALALGLGFIGFLGNPILIVIAVFVWMGAAQEASAAQMRSSLSGIPVRDAMITDYHTLARADSLRRAAELVIAGSQVDFPVVEGDGVVGILSRERLLSALAQRGQDVYVSEHMDRDFRAAEAHEMLQTAFERLQECSCRAMPVLEQDRLVGMITSENIGEFAMIRAALRRNRAQQQES